METYKLRMGEWLCMDGWEYEWIDGYIIEWLERKNVLKIL